MVDQMADVDVILTQYKVTIAMLLPYYYFEKKSVNIIVKANLTFSRPL